MMRLNQWPIHGELNIQTSEKTNFNVVQVFEKLAQVIVKYKYPKPKERAHHCTII